MSHYYSIPLIDQDELALVQRAVGPDLSRIIGYFGDDGAEAITLIEQAHAQGTVAALVAPAHRIKGESRQLGATRLGDIAEEIEKTARRCIEEQTSTATIELEISLLRVCFTQTLALLCEAAPVRPQPRPIANPSPAAPGTVGRPRQFGRRVVS